MSPAHNVTGSTGADDVKLAQLRGVSWMDTLIGNLLILMPLGVLGNVVFVLIAGDGSLFRAQFTFVPSYLIIAMLLSITPWFLGSLRLLLWSGFLGNRVRYREAFWIVLGAELGAAISPPMIGGSAIKAGMLMRQRFSGSAALSLAALEGAQDGLFFLLMTPLALALSPSLDLPVIPRLWSGIRHPSFTMIAAACAVAVVLAQPGFRSKVARFAPVARLASMLRPVHQALILTGRDVIFNGKSVFAFTFALTAVQWICRYSVLLLLLMSLGIPAQPIVFTTLQVLVFALMPFIPTPGGAGGAEAVFYLLYRPFLAPDMLGVVTAGWRFLTFYFLLILAAVLFLALGLRTKADKPVMAGEAPGKA